MYIIWLSLTHTNVVGLPKNRHSFPLAGSAVGNEGLAVAVFMNRTLAHVCYTRPTEGSMDKYMVHCNGNKLSRPSLALTGKKGRNPPHGGTSETPMILSFGTLDGPET